MIKMMMLNNMVSIFKHFSWSSACGFLLVPSRLTRTIKPLILRTFSPFRANLAYLLFLSFLGYLVLISTNLRLAPPNARLPGLEAAFMSISAVTSSSMSTVEMELFTNAQLLVLTLLMFLGGEVFTSMLALFLKTRQETSASRTPPDTNPSSLAELGFNKSNDVDDYAHTSPENDLTAVSFEKLTVVKALAYLVLAYILVIHFCGSLFVYLYMITAPTIAHVLKSKSILPSTFALFLTSSSFANCGFVPTNENMAAFRTDSVLLLLVVPQILMGNTLYPICIRILIRVMEFVTRNSLYTHMLSKSNPAGYSHLLSGPATRWFGWTGVAFVASQVVMLSALEWGSEAFRGMGRFERLAACLFQSVNSRHAGESVVDLAILSPAILVLFILMMYLPPYFTFMPCGDDGANRDQDEELRRSIESDRRNKNKKLRMENFIFSDLSNLTIFVILISITERKSLKSDPLNFNVLNIVLEVVSAYGNVGFSTGYSCKRRVDDNPFCEEKTYGFAGRWSIQGKLILIAVMIFGKLKKFNRNGGKAWRSY